MLGVDPSPHIPQCWDCPTAWRQPPLLQQCWDCPAALRRPPLPQQCRERPTARDAAPLLPLLLRHPRGHSPLPSYTAVPGLPNCVAPTPSPSAVPGTPNCSRRRFGIHVGILFSPHLPQCQDCPTALRRPPLSQQCRERPTARDSTRLRHALLCPIAERSIVPVACIVLLGPSSHIYRIALWY